MGVGVLWVGCMLALMVPQFMRGGGKVGYGFVVVTCAGEVVHREQLIAKGVGGNLRCLEADNNMAELTAVIEVIQSHPSEVKYYNRSSAYYQIGVL